MKRISPLAAAIAGTLLLATSLEAGIVSAHNPKTVLEIAKGYGSAQLRTDSGGDPLIVGRIDGDKYGIFFYGCDRHHKRCNDIQFSASWSGADVTLKQINRWNNSKRFGKAYLDKEGDPTIIMPVNLNGGVTRENLEDTFDWWDKVLRQFKRDVIDR